MRTLFFLLNLLDHYYCSSKAWPSESAKYFEFMRQCNEFRRPLNFGSGRFLSCETCLSQMNIILHTRKSYSDDPSISYCIQGRVTAMTPVHQTAYKEELQRRPQYHGILPMDPRAENKTDQRVDTSYSVRCLCRIFRKIVCQGNGLWYCYWVTIRGIRLG